MAKKVIIQGISSYNHLYTVGMTLQEYTDQQFADSEKNKYCTHDQYGRNNWSVTIPTDAPVLKTKSQAVDLITKSPDGQILHATEIRLKADGQVANAGLSGKAETVSDDLAPGSLNHKTPGILDAKILLVLYNSKATAWEIIEETDNADEIIRYLDNHITLSVIALDYNSVENLEIDWKTEEEIKEILYENPDAATAKMKGFVEFWETSEYQKSIDSL